MSDEGVRLTDVETGKEYVPRDVYEHAREVAARAAERLQQAADREWPIPNEGDARGMVRQEAAALREVAKGGTPIWDDLSKRLQDGINAYLAVTRERDKAVARAEAAEMNAMLWEGQAKRARQFSDERDQLREAIGAALDVLGTGHCDQLCEGCCHEREAAVAELREAYGEDLYQKRFE